MKATALWTGLLGLGAAGWALSSVAPRSSNVTLLDVLEAAETAQTCDDCQAMLKLIQDVADDGDEAYAQLAIGFCKAIQEYADDVCDGLMQLEAPSMAYSLRNMEIPSRTSTLWCAEIYGLCSVPSVQNYTVPFPKRKPCRKRPATSGKTPLKVVHISDIHVDLSYTVGASTNCTEEICCYPYSADLAAGVTDYPAGPWGDHACDSPLGLSLSMYEAIKKTVPDAAFTIFTGDVVEGREWLTTHSEIVTDIGSAYKHMSASGLDLVYGAVGNHEASPVNSFPQTGLVGVPANESNQYMYSALAASWSPWIGAGSAATAALHGGAYAVQHANNLRIISINTMFYMAENWWLYTPTMTPDPNGQFAWLVSELQAAENAHQRVYIIGHIPFGRPDALYDYSAYFDQIVQRYEATIAAHFFGHTHRDQWEVSYRNYTDQTAAGARAVHYIAPALTPTSGNPTFRVYDVDPETWAVLDYTVYVANMSAPEYQSTGPVWERYYSVKEAYGALLDPPYTEAGLDLTPAFWHNVSVLFEEDDAAFQAYYARKQRGYDYSACTGSCKTQEICQMRSSQSQYACLSGAAVSAKRDVEQTTMDVGNAHGHAGECPGSKARKVLAKLPLNLRLLRELAKEATSGKA
ncbi:Sphingomyelin phosphodiesterase [Pleurostoma richardsiae]|uniref:Sphingomyelin phosphodiesterase n=1 Tax=Pleurostoma richardsiae TaxID=41990 RepID=A0AA38VIC9_9PEZI|nr:Sphingomyelin phosphodiesterase [Pleurostoma richardsiae]